MTYNVFGRMLKLAQSNPILNPKPKLKPNLNSDLNRNVNPNPKLCSLYHNANTVV